MKSYTLVRREDTWRKSGRWNNEPMKAFGRVILSHTRSRMSRPESGSIIAWMTVFTSVAIVRGSGGSPNRSVSGMELERVTTLWAPYKEDDVVKPTMWKERVADYEERTWLENPGSIQEVACGGGLNPEERRDCWACWLWDCWCCCCLNLCCCCCWASTAAILKPCCAEPEVAAAERRLPIVETESSPEDVEDPEPPASPPPLAPPPLREGSPAAAAVMALVCSTQALGSIGRTGSCRGMVK